MTPNDLKLVQKVWDWQSESPERTFKIEGGEDYGWFGYETNVRVWLYDKEVMCGFFVYKHTDKFYTKEELKERKRSKMQKELDRMYA